MKGYAVAEKFVSINGEGPRAGELAVFIRFRRCNLACSYCDTKWVNTESCPAEFLSCEQLTEYVASAGVTNVTLTGGEPLLQAGIGRLIESLTERGNRVEIETNGSISLKELAEKQYRPVFTMDYKLPSSGMEPFMEPENFALLRSGDTVKFVSGCEADLERALEIIGKYELSGRCFLYFSPVYGRLDPEVIVEFMKRHRLNHTRLQLQLHKYIWAPDERGV